MDRCRRLAERVFAERQATPAPISQAALGESKTITYCKLFP
jgi:hypothetical protein